jgi:hypothetical protein
MNAAIFTKSAKGLILASGLIAASSVLGYAQDATVSLGSTATVPLSNFYANPPAGIASLGGHSFDMSTGNTVDLTNGQNAAFSGSWTNPTAAYLLLNSYNTYLWYDQQAIGSVTITFADGTTQTTTLTAGANIRDWLLGSGVADTTLTDPAAAQVWSGVATDGSTAATFDMLTITLPGTKNVSSVTIANTNAFGSLGIHLSGLTIDQQIPQPQNQCVRPGDSCSTPAAQNSQAWKWQDPNGSPNTVNPHANSGSGIGHGAGGGKGH